MADLSFPKTHCSTASEEQQVLYSEGQCHYLAVALHRHLGWELVLVVNPSEPYWEDEEDDENFIASVFHAYAVDPQGRAWDVFGWRPMDAMVAETQERFLGWNLQSEWVANEPDLQTFVGYWGEPEAIDRPLDSYDEQDIEQAWAMAQQVFAGLENWPGPPPLSKHRRPRP